MGGGIRGGRCERRRIGLMLMWSGGMGGMMGEISRSGSHAAAERRMSEAAWRRVCCGFGRARDAVSTMGSEA